MADYHDFHPPGGSQPIKARIWQYRKPTPAFESVAGYYSFYPSAKSGEGHWHAEVEGEKVEAQEGDVS